MKWLRTVLAGLACTFLWCGPPRPDLPPGESEDRPVRPYAEIASDLESPEWSVRSNAIVEVMQGEHREAIDRLLVLLQEDPHPAVRQTAALALGSFQERRATPIIARMLSTDTEITPDFLLDALTQMKDPAGGPAVVPFLAHREESYALKAADTLAEIGATAQRPAILALARQNTDNQRARIYAMALGRLNIRAAEPYLLNLARSSPPGPTLAASYLALGRIQSRAAGPLLVQALAADFDKGRENATEALIEIKDPAVLESVFALIPHTRTATRYAAADVIVGIPSPQSGPRALNMLSAESPLTIGPLSEVLGRLKYEPARTKIETLLTNRETEDRERLARSLGWLGGNASNELLIRVLREDDGEGRYGAAWALGILEAREARTQLEEAARSGDNRLAQIATEALGGLGDPASLDTLVDLAESRSSLRVTAVQSIASIEGDDARRVLEDFARSEDQNVRISAIRALGERREEQSVDMLMDLLAEERESDITRALMNALRAITGESHQTRGQWLHWYETR